MRITWRMYRTKKDHWVVYSGPISFTTAERFEIEKRLAKYGLRPEEIERLFSSEAEKGEGVVSVPVGLGASGLKTSPADGYGLARCLPMAVDWAIRP